jgi:hypothetical protein
MGAYLGVVKDEARYNLLRSGEGGVKGGVVLNSKVSSKDMEGSFVRAHGWWGGCSMERGAG